MIPTMILFGLAFGRWWFAALVGAAVFMPALGILGGAVESVSEVLLAAGIGVANASVGIAVHQLVLRIARRWA